LAVAVVAELELAVAVVAELAAAVAAVAAGCGDRGYLI